MSLIFIKSLEKVKEALCKEYGKFVLFAVLKQDDANRYDLLVSADWLGTTRDDIFKIATCVTKILSADECVQIARIVPLQPDSEFVRTYKGFYLGYGMLNFPLRILYD